MNSAFRDYVCLLVVVCSSGLWPTSAICQEPVTLKGHTGAVICAAFSPDGKRIVSGSADATSEVWDAHGFSNDCR